MLLRLEEPVTFTDRIRPVCLPDADVAVGEELTMLGYGKDPDPYLTYLKSGEELRRVTF